MAVNNSFAGIASSNSPSLSQLKGPPGRPGPPGPAGPPGEPVSGRFGFIFSSPQVSSYWARSAHKFSRVISQALARHQTTESVLGLRKKHKKKTDVAVKSKWQHPVVRKCTWDHLVFSVRFKSGNINDRSAAGHRRRGSTRKTKKHKNNYRLCLLPHPSLVNLHFPTYLYSYVVRAQAVEEERKTFIAHFMFLRSTRSTTQSVFPKLQRATIILTLSSSGQVIKASPQALQMKNPRVKVWKRNVLEGTGLKSPRFKGCK